LGSHQCRIGHIGADVHLVVAQCRFSANAGRRAPTGAWDALDGIGCDGPNVADELTPFLRVDAPFSQGRRYRLFERIGGLHQAVKPRS
jgi:hypothetical protein